MRSKQKLKLDKTQKIDVRSRIIARTKREIEVRTILKKLQEILEKD